MVLKKYYSDNFEQEIKIIIIIKIIFFRNNIQKLSKLYYDRPLSPQDTAAFWVEYVIRNGNILRSPAANLEWWQVELLDVYGFILLTTLLVLYIGLLSIRIFLKKIFDSKKKDKDALLSKKQK